MTQPYTAMSANELPPAVRAAIAAVVNCHLDGAQRDYLGGCDGAAGTVPGGHVFEDMVLLRRWLEGSIDGLHVETEVWIDDPERPGYLRLIRRKTIAEVYREILALVGKDDGGFTVVDGADEYFGIHSGASADREWPQGRIVVFAVAGSSEGHYVRVEVQTDDSRSELLILGKGFAGADAAWALARRLAWIMGV
jgi:hypothetical protein